MAKSRQAEPGPRPKQRGKDCLPPKLRGNNCPCPKGWECALMVLPETPLREKKEKKKKDNRQYDLTGI